MYRFQAGGGIGSISSTGTYMIGEREDGKFVKYEDYKKEIQYYNNKLADALEKLDYCNSLLDK